MIANWSKLSQAERDAAYNNNQAVANSAELVERRNAASAAFRKAHPAGLDVAYGSAPRQRFDLFAAKNPAAPCLVFIHGGYWQRNEKERFSCGAQGPRAHGIDVAAPGYTLGPQARLTDIVAEMRQALSFLADRANELGFDREKIVISGWSAGGHLTAAVADHPAVRGGLPISGIFDLEPIALGVLNDKLSLSADEVVSLSPLRTLGGRLPPLRLFVGGDELPELKRQSEDYANAASARGLPVSLTVLPGHHHFSILNELERPDGAITRALVALVAA